MPPKIQITKDAVVAAALDLVRKNGAAALNARSLAQRLQCSTQPIFSHFSTMEALRLAVAAEADALYRQYAEQEIASGQFPAYKASGMAYIRFAKEEKELFKLLFMCDRSGEVLPDFEKSLLNTVQTYTGLSAEDARRFHLEMWVCVHGIATMIATDFLEWDAALISDTVSDIFFGLKARYQDKT